MKELSLFTGMGGGIYGSLILDWKTLAYVEKDKYCQSVIKQRQADGWFDQGEIYGDIKEFNEKYAKKYTGKIDILTGGFPCQPFSVAGIRKGTRDERYLFFEIIKTIKIVQPRWLFFENVPGILSSNAIIEIYKQVNQLGYQTKPPLVLGSDDCGNIHRRKRVWIYASNPQKQPSDECKPKAILNTKQQEQQFRNSVINTHARRKRIQRIKQEKVQGQPPLQRCENIRKIEDLFNRPDIPQPLFCGVDDELSSWRKQLKAIGNGQDPIVMAAAWKILTNL